MSGKVDGSNPDSFPSERDELTGAPKTEHVGAHSEDDFPTASDDEIATRAYYRYLERGGTDGQDVDDWLAAKAEVSRLRK